MTVRRVVPGSVRGRLTAPPSKSYTHRALVAGFFHRGPYSVVRPLDADDTRATAGGLRALGARVRFGPSRWRLEVGRHVARGRSTVSCGESGTTLRFLTALAAREGPPTRFVGRGRLSARPMRPLARALRTLGAAVEPASGSVPFIVRGPIHAGTIALDASESSQFTSALLLVLPTLDGPSTVRLRGRIASEPYLDATLAVLRAHGVRATRRGRTFRTPGGQVYGASRFVVPGDASSAAYLWAAGAIAGGPVTVQGISRGWPQADLAILSLLRRAGASVAVRGAAITVREGPLRPFSVDLTASPDLYPLAGVLAAAAPGRSVLRGAAHVVHKESDRRAETRRLVSALGGRVRAHRGGLLVDGGRPFRPLDLTDLTDHRLVMSAAVAALRADGESRVGVAEAVRKSYPGFWNDLVRLGVEVRP